MAHKFLSGPFYLFQLIEENENRSSKAFGLYCFLREISRRLLVTFIMCWQSEKETCDWKIYEFIMNSVEKLFMGKCINFNWGNCKCAKWALQGATFDYVVSLSRRHGYLSTFKLILSEISDEYLKTRPSCNF